ncbi:MAG TPA: hypothetical protein PK890_05105 [Terrimesophilobacter sp.]|nr:hypothetical protein [Terrimesophilobacter sp.]
MADDRSMPDLPLLDGDARRPPVASFRLGFTRPLPCPACGNAANVVAPGRGAYCSQRCVDEITGEVVMVTVYLALAGGHQLVGVPNEALAYFWGRVQREANWARRVHALTTTPRVLSA